jgi:hypothetical protein
MVSDRVHVITILGSAVLLAVVLIEGVFTLDLAQAAVNGHQVTSSCREPSRLRIREHYRPKLFDHTRGNRTPCKQVLSYETLQVHRTPSKKVTIY